MAENRVIISTFYGGERYKSLYYFGAAVTRFQTLQTGTRVSSLTPPPLPVPIKPSHFITINLVR